MRDAANRIRAQTTAICPPTPLARQGECGVADSSSSSSSQQRAARSAARIYPAGTRVGPQDGGLAGDAVGGGRWPLVRCLFSSPCGAAASGRGCEAPHGNAWPASSSHQEAEIVRAPSPQPSVVGLRVLARCSQGSAQTPLANTLLSPRPVTYSPCTPRPRPPCDAEP
jgi:hypothetical protein